MKSDKRILIAGIGNIFFGDDAFGCEVARKLAALPWPSGVEVRDFGIRGIDLAFAMMERLDRVILIDAVPRGGTPGTVYLIEPDLNGIDERPDNTQSLWDAHTMNPVKVLCLARSMGAVLDNVLIVGCEPERLLVDEDVVSGLSQPVAAAVDQAVAIVKTIVEQLISSAALDYNALNLNAPNNFAEHRPEIPVEETAF